MVDATLKPGDTVVCKVKESTIVESYTKDYDEKRVFEIIAVNYQGWHIYIPSYTVIKGSVLVSARNHQSLGIHKKFIGEETVFLTSSFIVKVERILTGMICDRCNEYFDHAVANQEHGIFICWCCRHYPNWVGRLP